MNRELKVRVSDIDIKSEIFKTAEKVAPSGGKGAVYGVNVCRYLKEMTEGEEDFTNEVPKGDAFTSVVNTAGSIDFVTSAESVHLPTLHKFIDYLLQWYQDFDISIEFGGRVYTPSDL